MKSLLLATSALVFCGAASAQEFPLTIEHKFGSSTIEAKPERVATLDYNGADNLLAFGIQPVAIRNWYGEFPETVWPWAEEALTATPEIIQYEIDYEQLAKVEPDVILATWSGISAEDYEKLSLIAPVVAVPEGVGDYSLPWDQLALIAGRATGHEASAEELVTGVKAQLDTIAARHPDWQGKTASVVYYWDDAPGVYTREDIRAQILAAMGLETPQAVNDEAVAGKFVLGVSEERLDILDADVLIWVVDEPDEIDNIKGLALRPALTAYAEGREVFTDRLLSGAFSHASLLSLPYVLERLEPKIDAAIDGDPATEVPDN